MTAGMVRTFEVFPDAGPLDLRLIDSDGEQARIVASGDNIAAEVWIASERNADGLTLVVPLSFATFDLAKDAAAILSEAFERVRTIQLEEPAEQCFHHKPRSVRRSRKRYDSIMVCERCAMRFVPEPNQ